MAATDKLNDKAIKAAIKVAVESGKARRISDGNGLFLDVRPTGAGWWRLRFWRDGKEGMLSLGTYPDVPLKLARERREESRQSHASGVDLSEQRKTEKAEKVTKREADKLAAEGKPGPGTFEFVAREWVETIHRAKVSTGHAERTLIRFEQDAFPWIGRVPIADLEAPALLAVLRRVVARGAIETTHRLKDACGQVFRYGIATGLCKRDPAADLRDALPPVASRNHAAIIKPDEAAQLLRDMANYRGHPVTRAALMLSAMWMLRPGEVRQAEWVWVNLDEATMTIPGAVIKGTKQVKLTRPPHEVPLARQACAILAELQPLTGTGKYIFPSILTCTRPMSDNTVNVALRRMGYDRQTMTAHGFRAMARTMAQKWLGINPAALEEALTHGKGDAHGGAYDRTEWLAERVDAMQKWADYLDRLRDGSNVVQLKGAA